MKLINNVTFVVTIWVNIKNKKFCFAKCVSKNNLPFYLKTPGIKSTFRLRLLFQENKGLRLSWGKNSGEDEL